MRQYIEIKDNVGRVHILFPTSIVDIMDVSNNDEYENCNSIIYTLNEKVTISTRASVNEILVMINSRAPLL